MPDQFKVPEAVLGAFEDTALIAQSLRFEAGIEAALKQYNEELLGDEAVDAAGRYCEPPCVHAKGIIEVAIDSVMKENRAG